MLTCTDPYVAVARILSLEAEVERLRQALTFYACESPCDTCVWEDDDVVCGERARKALAGPIDPASGG